jgi:small conductance mechanosensitive channel
LEPTAAGMSQIFSSQHIDAVVTLIWASTISFLPRLVTAIAILILGAILARWASRAAFGLAGRAGHLDVTVRPIIGSIVRYSILILVFIGALTQIGVQTASLFAVLGAAGLAIGLALQGTLSNIAAGIMLLWLRPFHLSDYIEVNGIGGTVRKIDLFACHLETFDGIFLFVPNSGIWNNALKNHSRNAGRLISVDITVSAKADIARGRQLLLDMAASDGRIAKLPQPRVFVENFAAAGIVLNLRIWASPGNVAEVQRSVIEDAKRVLEAAGAEPLIPQQITRIVPPDTDPSRLLPTSQPYVD